MQRELQFVWVFIPAFSYLGHIFSINIGKTRAKFWFYHVSWFSIFSIFPILHILSHFFLFYFIFFMHFFFTNIPISLSNPILQFHNFTFLYLYKMLMWKYPSVYTTPPNYCRIHWKIWLNIYLSKEHPKIYEVRKFPIGNLKYV